MAYILKFSRHFTMLWDKKMQYLLEVHSLRDKANHNKINENFGSQVLQYEYV